MAQRGWCDEVRSGADATRQTNVRFLGQGRRWDRVDPQALSGLRACATEGQTLSEVLLAEALLLPSAREAVVEAGDRDPATDLLRSVAWAKGRRLNELEVHQLAREVGLDRAALARLYNGDPALLSTDKQDRVITDARRATLG